MSKSILSLALMLSVTAGAMAEIPVPKPDILHIKQAEAHCNFYGVSDNGLWATAYTYGDNAMYSSPRLVNVETGEYFDLFEDKSAPGEANDVTNDGKMVVGSVDGAAAYYDVNAKKWNKLPMPNNVKNSGSTVFAVTPDGKYAVGRALTTKGNNNYAELGLAWDFTSGTPVCRPTNNLPDFDTNGDPCSMIRFISITPDGRYSQGIVDYIYPMTSWSFIYDFQEQSWKALGYDYVDGKLVSNTDGKYIVDEVRFSPDGKRAIAGLLNADDESEVGIFDMATGKIEAVDGGAGKMICSVDNNGVIYAASPTTTPMRNWSFYVDGYWYDWKDAIKQLWNMDWQTQVTKDEIGLSGTFMSASDDCLRLFAPEYSGYPGGAFAIKLSKPLSEMAEYLDPLYEHMVYPTEGSSFSSMRSITVYFDRDIEVVGERTGVQLLDENGNVVKNSISVSVEAGQTRNLLITFRNAPMEAGKTYTVLIPEGMIQVSGDPRHPNKEIRINYVGRADTPVKPVKISPESGTALPRLNMNTNPVVVTFDAVLSVIEGGSIALYRHVGDEDVFLYSLNSTISGSTMTIFPVAEQQLAKDVTYKVIINPNTVGDIAGNNGNERIEISYIGTYENDAPLVDGVIFSEDFNMGLSNMMLFDGDQQNPVAEVANWGFKAEYPWWYVRDNEDTMEQSAASHSMYTPAGKSDDWMVTRRLYIPDDSCTLSFDSQSYKNNREDYLKVYILTTDDIYTAPITKPFIDRFKSEGELVYNEKQEPGKSGELLAGDWKHNVLKLDKYAGKNIYIAFVNDNENQSAIFLDNVLVQQDMAFTFGVDATEFVVDGTSIPVKVKLSVLSEETYDDFTLNLYDGEGDVVASKELTGLNLKKGDAAYAYTFEKELPLTKGRLNEYSVEAASGDKKVVMNKTVKNLRFQPERVVVIEEGTGTKCGYCPLGHRALEIIDETYGDKVIPVAVHSYSGGSDFMTNWTSSYGSFLGFAQFPIGLLNRQYVASPMAVTGNTYSLTSEEGDNTWVDYLPKMMSELTDAEIHIDHATIDKDKKMIEVGVNMRYAYDNDNVNLNLYTVVLENGLKARQTSNVSNNESEILGDWGKGGKYGKPSVSYTFDHIARGMHGTSYAGVPGLFPRQVNSADTYKQVYAFEAPMELEDMNNAEVVVMLLDANSQRVINAAKAPCLVGVVGVDNVFDENARANGDVYNIAGVKVLENATIEDVNRLEKGIYIFNGKKVMVR